MSKDGTQTYNGGGSKSSTKSMWMSRWERTCSNSALQLHGQISMHGRSGVKDCDSNQEHRDIVVASNAPQTSEVVGAVTEAKEVKNLRKGVSELPHRAIFDFTQNVESILAQKKVLSVRDVLSSKEQIDNSPWHVTTTVESNDPHLPSKLLRLVPGEKLTSGAYVSEPDPKQSVKSCALFTTTSLPVLKLFPDRRTESMSDSVPYGVTSRGKDVQSIRIREERNPPYSEVASEGQFTSTDFTYLEHENSNYHRNSTFLVCDKRTDNQLVSRNSGLPSSISCPAELNRLEKMNHGCLSAPEKIFSVGGVENLRASTGESSMVGMSGVPSKSPHPTHMFLKKTSKEDTTVSTKFIGSASAGLFTLLPGFDCQDNFAVFQPLGSSTSSKGKEVVGLQSEFPGLKNEASAETETMDIGFCQTRKSPPSITSSTSNMILQDAIADQNLVLSPPLGKERTTKTESLDIGQELPSTSSAAENMNMSPSKTESLELEHVFPCLELEQAGASDLNRQLYGIPCPESISRGIKRLKPKQFDSHAHGTKSMKIGSSSYYEQVNKYIKFKDNSKASSGPILAKLLGKGQMELDKTVPRLGKNEWSATHSMQECYWIKRWCRNQAAHPETEPVTAAASERENSKTPSDEFQRKQFPSISAMALLGKTVKEFQPCELQRKGSFVVWNTG